MRGNKYKAKRADGFPSKLEKAVYDMLVNKYGEDCVGRQSKVYLTDARVLYIADFKISVGDNEFWAEAKGVELSSWRLKKKLWSCYGPGPLLIYRGHYQNVKLVEELIPKRKAPTCPGCGVRVDLG